MVFLVTLLVPPALLLLVVAMERVERPLREESVGELVVEFLEHARPDELESFVSRGAADALGRYWRRHRRDRDEALAA